MERHKVKNDDLKLVEACQFIRENFPRFRVEREWFVFWNHDGTLNRVSPVVSENNMRKYRHPDIMVFDKGTGRLLFAIEIDGSIHDSKVEDTAARNLEYEIAGIPLEVINEAGMPDIYMELRTVCLNHAED